MHVGSPLFSGKQHDQPPLDADDFHLALGLLLSNEKRKRPEMYDTVKLAKRRQKWDEEPQLAAQIRPFSKHLSLDTTHHTLTPHTMRRSSQPWIPSDVTRSNASTV